MVQVVLAKVVFRQICDVGELDMWYVGGPQHTNIHIFLGFENLSLLEVDYSHGLSVASSTEPEKRFFEVA
jgi:hypothetical protein